VVSGFPGNEAQACFRTMLIDPVLVVLVSVRMLVRGRWPPGYCY
jgi:hypothetical protein